VNFTIPLALNAIGYKNEAWKCSSINAS
jgi:hypothetical protein